MLNRRDPNQALSGYHYKNYRDQEGAYFEYAIEDRHRSTQIATIRNLICREGSVVISTTWKTDFKAGDYIEYFDGNWYHIDDVQVDYTADAPQVMCFFKPPSPVAYLSIRLVNNPKGGALL